MLRSTGVNYDVRKHQPYLVYDQLDFEVPLGTTGDNLDRYHVRMQEMEQSLRIAEQALRNFLWAVNVDRRTEIEAHELVDRAKMGLTKESRDIGSALPQSGGTGGASVRSGLSQGKARRPPCQAGHLWKYRRAHESFYARDERTRGPASHR